jgi:hypothetical protein
LNDCNEWKTEKHHDSTNVAQLQMTQIMIAAVTDEGTLAKFMNIKAA